MDKKKLERLQLLEQNLQNFLLQRQNIKGQLNEIASALKELDGSTQSFRIIGNIMVTQEKDKLKQELEERKESLDLRLNSISRQEEKTKNEIESMQGDLMAEMKKNGSAD